MTIIWKTSSILRFYDFGLALQSSRYNWSVFHLFISNCAFKTDSFALNVCLSLALEEQSTRYHRNAQIILGQWRQLLKSYSITFSKYTSLTSVSHDFIYGSIKKTHSSLFDNISQSGSNIKSSKAVSPLFMCLNLGHQFLVQQSFWVQSLVIRSYSTVFLISHPWDFYQY
jgi:hypothetical protein